MDQATAGLVGAGIGAGGAVIAQIIASAFAQRSTTKRFDWEREQAQQRSEAERQSRFADEKHELFAAFLAQHSSFRTELSGVPVPAYQSSERCEVMQRWPEVLRELEGMRQRIVLLAPSLEEATRSLMEKSAEAFVQMLNEGQFGECDRSFKPYREQIQECRVSMSQHLGVAEIG